MYIWPAHLFRPTTTKADVVVREVSGGVALSDDETTILTDAGGRWMVTHSDIVLRSPVQLRAWDAWTSYMGGRAFLVPLTSLMTAPRPLVSGVPTAPGALTANDPVFATSVGFTGGPYIEAETVGAAVLRATVLTIDILDGSQIEGGEKFSVAGRAYKIERVTARSGTQATCIITPPLRAAIADGAAVNFDWPTVQCKLVPDQDLAPMITFGRRAEMSISFIEDFSA